MIKSLWLKNYPILSDNIYNEHKKNQGRLEDIMEDRKAGTSVY